MLRNEGLKKHIRPGSEISPVLWEGMIQVERDRSEGRLTSVEYTEALGRLASREALEKLNRRTDRGEG